MKKFEDEMSAKDIQIIENILTDKEEKLIENSDPLQELM